MNALALRLLLPGIVAGAAAVEAATADDLVLGAMRLSDQPNYSWRTTITDDADTYVVLGRTERGGVTWQRQPLSEAIARRVGRPIGTDCQAFYQDHRRWVIATGEGWQRLDELPRRHHNWREDEGVYVLVPNSPVLDPWGESHAVYVPPRRDLETAPFSNYRFGLALPEEELAIIVNNFGDVAGDQDAIAGTLSPFGAALLLLGEDDGVTSVLGAKGEFKLWLRDGQVVKYALRLAGALAMKQKRLLVHQNSITEISAVGSTVCDVPTEARRKLGL